MKVLLTTLNSKYIHSNLAIRYLAKYVEDIIKVDIEEYTINQNRDLIISEIHKMKLDLIGFSTYIWNLDEILKISQALKLINPSLEILLGGPEVSYDGVDIMEKHPYIDYIIYGEGEESFRDLIKSKIIGEDHKKNLGLIYRENNEIIQNKAQTLIKDLNMIPTPYIDGENLFKNRIVYYESSRGCPFSCEFCLSSTIRGVRYFDLERVKKDLSLLIDWQVQQVKFVDRTFNANKKYAMEIMKFIISKKPKNMNFHFEVTAHLIDDEMLDFLSKVEEGLIQFEIGVQSTNEETIEAIGRTTDFEKLKRVVKKLSSFKNIHQHLDLIAGLPFEDIKSFEKSFNEVYELHPEKLQLGFLKLLKGSGLRFNAEKYGYKYINEPPYEILENNYIDYDDIVKLKGIEDLVEKYYNEDYFKNTLKFIVKNYYKGAFNFYEDFLGYWEEKEYHMVSHGRNKLYFILKDFIIHKEYKDKEILVNLLSFDYLKNHRSSLPPGLNEKDLSVAQKNVHDILKDHEILNKYIPNYRDLPTKHIIKKVGIEKFNVDILGIIDKNYQAIDNSRETYILFDYREGQIIRSYYYDITENIREMV